MNIKRSLIERLPPSAKRLLAVPYDMYQTRTANKQFAERTLPEYEPDDDAPRHIVCVVVDALRTDHVDDKLTPYLSSLNGCNAITPGAWTFPAVSSMVTGAYPHEHGAMRQTDDPEAVEGFSLPPRMDEDRETITEALAGAGYETYGGFGHDTPFVALSGRFHEHDLFHNVTATAEDVFDAHLDWVAGRERTFSFLHLADPHIPVDPPDRYWEAHDIDRSIDDLTTWAYHRDTECEGACERYREHRRRLYRAAVDYVDDALAEFADGLDATLDESLLLVTADHGEALWDHVRVDVERFDASGCVGHGGAPYEGLARVPLLTDADWPLEDGASLVDLAPTLADAVGIDWSAPSGRSLRSTTPGDRMPLVEGTLEGHEKKAIYDGEYKLVVSRGDGVELGYQLPAEEQTDVPSERREAMLEGLPAWPDGQRVGTEVSDVVEDRLEQLGYR
jgi:arylsulfatase A-like enzyme